MEKLIQDNHNSTQKEFCDVLQIILPLWIFCYLSFIGISSIDKALADIAYLGNGQWLLSDNFIAHYIIHKAGKYIPAIIAGVALVILILSFTKKYSNLGDYRNRALYVLASIAIATGGIGLGKAMSGTFCPFNLPIYGGDGIGGGNCYPAGHASAAFSLLCLYFVFLDINKKLSKLFLTIVVTLGIIFALTRQFQGAHFLSHSLATFAFDWLVCSFLYRVSLGRHLKSTKPALPSHAQTLCLFVIAYWLIFLNNTLFLKIYSSLDFKVFGDYALVVSVFVILLLVFFVIVNSLTFNKIVKIVLVLLTTIAAVANYFSTNFGIIFNADMIRNAIATDTAEAIDFVNTTLFINLFITIIPVVYIAFASKLKNYSIKKAIIYKFGSSALALVIALVLVWTNFQGLSSLIRNQSAIKHLITPLNIISSTIKTTFTDANPEENIKKTVIDKNPRLGEINIQPRGSLIFVVVGETARAANWGLAGYSRQTTPELAKRNVISFNKTISCGTSTDVSLPCMFSQVGRDNYDRSTILKEESLLAVMKRAGSNVYWMDNQSGCKGVCKDIPMLNVDMQKMSTLCKNGHCFDGAMLPSIPANLLNKTSENTVIFMHEIGNHGPAYYKRYPKDFEKFIPACHDSRLQNCTLEQITNAYDNALLYTDHVLAGMIDYLNGIQELDTALLYVSDHGESLGENNMYLHGAPYFMAPEVQTHVPMIMWISKGMKDRLALDTECLQEIATTNTNHDMLYSTLLGITDIESKTYKKSLDFTEKCRNKAKAIKTAKKRSNTSIDPQVAIAKR